MPPEEFDFAAQPAVLREGAGVHAAGDVGGGLVDERGVEPPAGLTISAGRTPGHGDAGCFGSGGAGQLHLLEGGAAGGLAGEQLPEERMKRGGGIEEAAAAAGAGGGGCQQAGFEVARHECGHAGEALVGELLALRRGAGEGTGGGTPGKGAPTGKHRCFGRHVFLTYQPEGPFRKTTITPLILVPFRSVLLRRSLLRRFVLSRT